MTFLRFTAEILKIGPNPFTSDISGATLTTSNITSSNSALFGAIANARSPRLLSAFAISFKQIKANTKGGQEIEKYVWGMYNMCIEGLFFEWDENKNIVNQKKHGISFEEARSVFYDENALLEYDISNSDSEDRFRILGRSISGKILLVVHCIRSRSTIRIISSRKATATEKRGYERSISL